MKPRWVKPLLFVVCLIPLALLAQSVRSGTLANPVEYITHTTGDWTIRFVLITLTITPLRVLLKQPNLARFRRMLGLFAFFYGTLHFATWFALDKGFDLSEMWKDVLKRTFITAGFTGYVLMIPLAITSTAGWVRRLGFKRWQQLHRLIYITAAAGVIHYYWRDSARPAGIPLLHASPHKTKGGFIRVNPRASAAHSNPAHIPGAPPAPRDSVHPDALRSRWSARSIPVRSR
jgi:sulfoxide reductase heme-binding subunit YedZ